MPLEIVNMPFRDSILVTYLHKPVGVENIGFVGISRGGHHSLRMAALNDPRDPGNPPSDMLLTYESVVESDLWMLGLGEHCAVEYWPVVIPDVAEWLIEKFAN